MCMSIETYGQWCRYHRIRRARCPKGCERPLPIVFGSDEIVRVSGVQICLMAGVLYCGRCLEREGRAIEMIPEVEEERAA